MTTPRRLGDITKDIVDEHRRKTDLRRFHDGPIPPRLLKPQTLDQRIAKLKHLISEGERRAAEAEDNVTLWLELGLTQTAQACRRDAKSMADTVALYRACLAELVAQREPTP